jgi:CHAT domain-containing protein
MAERGRVMSAPASRACRAFGLAFALLAGPLFAQEPSSRATVEAVVQRFYSVYASGDLDGLLAMWEPGSPSLPAFREETAPILRTRCMTLREVTIDSLKVESGRATAGVYVVLSKRGRTMPERDDPHSATLELVRSGEEWRITKWTLREEELVGRLLAARDEAERGSLLQAEPRLLTPALARALCRRGVLAANQSRYDDAVILLHLLERVASLLNDPAAQASAVSFEGVLHRLLPSRDYPLSLALAYRSVALAEESSDPDAIARASLRAGRTLYTLGRHDEALPWNQRAFSLRDEVEEDSVISLAAGSIAQIYSDRGDHHAAKYYAAIAQATAKDDFGRAGAEMNLGGEYIGQGDCRLAIPHLQRSIDFSRKAGFDGVTMAAGVLAQCDLALGQGEEAFRITSEALVTLGPDPDPDGAALFLVLRSRYFINKGLLGRAEADLLEALRLSRAVGNPRAEIGPLTELASLRLRQRRYREARALGEQAASRAEGFEPDSLLVVARAERHIGRRNSAYRVLRRLIDTTEEEAAAFHSDERRRQSFFESRAGAYVELADMLVQDGRFDEALVVAERGRGRLLLDVLQGGKLLQYAALTAAERAQEAALEHRISVLNMQSAASPANEEKVAQPLLEARRQLEDYRADLCSKYPRLVEHPIPAPLSLHDTSALLPDSTAAFVEYFVTESRLVIFVVTRGGAHPLHVHTIPLSRERLENETGALLDALAKRNLRFRDRARRLYDLILAPAAAELSGVKTLAIIPDGPLWQLPFESLVMPDGRFLIERRACFYAPSISVYREMIRHGRPRPSGAFLAFANPSLRRGDLAVEAKLRSSEGGPLPDAEREVERIARFFRDGKRLYVGPEALESRVKAESGAYDVLHFATHGVLDDNNPMYSHLLLAASPGDSSEDGFLETWELMRLDLHAELAVLSACDTARGTVHAGEGLIGMSWALFVAGCSSTVVTQWKVPSSAAADLMIDFYHQWLHPGTRSWFAKAEALRQARLHLLRDGKHRDPFYWSGYVLVGSGR